MRCTNRSERGNTAAHRCRNFDLSKSDYIEQDRTDQNVYYIYMDEFSGRIPEGALPSRPNFENTEKALYDRYYGEYLIKFNEKCIRDGHRSRCKTIDDYYFGKKTAPDEAIFQVGNIEESLSQEDLLEVWERYEKAFEKLYPSDLLIYYSNNSILY